MTNAQLSFCSVGSGSEGNGLLVRCVAGSQRTVVMIDCGFKIGEVRERLALKGLQPQDLSAIFVTHEHKDHLGGVVALARAAALPVYGSRGTLRSIKAKHYSRVHFCVDEKSEQIGLLKINPFSVPHDAHEPLHYTVQMHHTDSPKLGVLTDAGHVSQHMVKSLSGSTALYLEFNHDPLMLRQSTYPARLRARIAGNYGHLSNQQAVKLLQALTVPKPQIVVAAHLSQRTNTPEKVRTALGDYLQQFTTVLTMADQEQGFDWIALPMPEPKAIAA